MLDTIRQPPRSGLHGGDPRASAALLPRFLSFVGDSYVTSVCRKHGLPMTRIASWVSGCNVLPDDLQMKVEFLLKAAGR